MLLVRKNTSSPFPAPTHTCSTEKRGVYGWSAKEALLEDRLQWPGILFKKK
jgi:hypothetical protein